MILQFDEIKGDNSIPFNVSVYRSFVPLVPIGAGPYSHPDCMTFCYCNKPGLRN